MPLKNLIPAPIRTNENGARTKLIVASAITVAAVAAGIYLTKKNAQVPVVLIVEEAVETITDNATTA
jgi:hypothetical protein